MIHGSLGPNYAHTIDEIIHEQIVYIHDQNCGSKERSNQFLNFVDNYKQQLIRRLAYYERTCGDYRRKNNLTPFSWAKETPGSVRDAFLTKNGKPKTPTTPAERERRKARAIRALTPRYKAPDPEFDPRTGTTPCSQQSSL